MRKIQQPFLKLGFSAGYLLFLAWMHKEGIGCLFRTRLGFSCPGCGMTRALAKLLHLDFKAAFSYHPMVFFLPLMYLYFLYDGKLFGKKADATVWICLTIGFVAQWLPKL